VKNDASQPGGPNPGVQALIDAETVRQHLSPFITVIPDGGPFGWYSDWYGSDVDGTTPKPVPAWATYHTGELIPWVDAHYRTKPDRQHRAVAGLSMGGFGAMSYAARYPDLFGTAGSFSGVVDTDADWPGTGLLLGSALSPILSASLFNGEPRPQDCVWGDAVTQDVNWRGANPTYLAPNLAHTSLFVAYGNGLPGPYDDVSSPSGFSGYLSGLVEAGMPIDNRGFTSTLTSDGIPYTEYAYGPGTHTFPYFLRDLTYFLPQMNAQFAKPLTAALPTPFSYRTVQPQFSVGGWSFAARRLVTEFTYLDQVSAAGLHAIGSGMLHVTSGAAYVPRDSYTVTVQSKAPGFRHLSVLRLTADGSGRLAFPVDLGSAHTVQQYVFGPADTQAFPLDYTPPNSPPQRLYAKSTPPGWIAAEVTITRG
jgi:S-formylglutathione hydrolase FrmB